MPNLGLFCAVTLVLPLIFGVLSKFVAGDPFEQLIVFTDLLAGLFGFIYALYSLVAVAAVAKLSLLAIGTFPFVGLVTCCC